VFAYRSWQLRRVLDGARRVVAPTHFVRDVYQRLGWPVANVQVVPHGIDVPDGIDQAGRRVSERRGLRAGYIGGLAWQKGVHVLIEAVNQMPNADVSLLIYGNLDAFPDYVSTLKRLAQHPGIAFAGYLSRAEVWTRLQELDVVVVPSLWYETSSLVIQEAFACGVPAVASDIGALRERVRDGIDGKLVPPGDALALKEVLRQLADDPASLDRMRAGIQPVRTMADHAREIAGIYEAVAARIEHPSSTR